MERPTVAGAPGLTWRQYAGCWAAIWVAGRPAVRKGYKPRRVRLWPPADQPDALLTDAAVAIIRSECLRLQNDMLRSFGMSGPGAPTFDGTFRDLVRVYQIDSDSPFHGLRYRSRGLYVHMMKWMATGLGDTRLVDIKGRTIKGLFAAWSQPGEGGKRRVARAHYAMSMLRILFGFGWSILEDADCKRLAETMAEMKFENGRPRREVISREQAIAIRSRAHAAGYPSVALVQAIAFSLGLRQKDIIGEWVPASEPGISDVTRHTKKWLFGLHWREISADLILTHRLSKSVRGHQVLDMEAGKTKVFDLRLYPMVMEEISHIPLNRRVGPMVIDETTKRPYRDWDFGARWRIIAEAAEVPRKVQQRDSRAGAATEIIEVAGLEAARISLGHSRVETTIIYSREDERRTADVARLRSRKGEEPK